MCNEVDTCKTRTKPSLFKSIAKIAILCVLGCVMLGMLCSGLANRGKDEEAE